MSDILDLKQPYRSLDGKGAQSDFVLQDGKIYGWSESNVRYERAWWLNDKGYPLNNSPIACILATERPFDPAWLLS